MSLLLQDHVRAQNLWADRGEFKGRIVTFEAAAGEFFELSEFADRNTGRVVVDLETLAKLRELRQACGFPFHLSSAFREELTNLEVGGHPRSAHKVGRAYDIGRLTGPMALTIITRAPSFGFHGIGVKRPIDGRGYVHIDDVDRDFGATLWSYSHGS